MGLTPGMRIKDIAVDTVFIGSCTNGRLEDLRVAASIMKGHHKAENIHRVLVVPASSRVRLQAEKEGLDKIFKDFGAEWRNAGCSMSYGHEPRQDGGPRTFHFHVKPQLRRPSGQGVAHALGIAGSRRSNRHPRYHLVSGRPVNPRKSLFSDSGKS